MAIELTYRINQYFGGKPQSTQVWKSLRYLNFYRVILAALFVIPVLAEQKMYGLGEHNLKLFTLVSYSYLLVAVFASFAIHWKKPSFKALLFGLTFLDIGVLTVLMHASGGVQSGIGLLIVIAIAGNSLLISGRIAGFFASLAAVFILGEQVYSHLEGIEATTTHMREYWDSHCSPPPLYRKCFRSVCGKPKPWPRNAVLIWRTSRNSMNMLLNACNRALL